MSLHCDVRTIFIVAITLTFFMIAMILVSNPFMFAAAKGGTIDWNDVPDPTKRNLHDKYDRVFSNIQSSENKLLSVSDHQHRRLYVPLPFWFTTAAPTDNSLSVMTSTDTIAPNVQGGQPFPVASNSMSYGGGNIPVNLPRFDREAQYYRHVATHSFVLVPVKMDSPLLLNDGSAYSTGNNPYGQISQSLPPSTYSVLLPGSEIYSIGDPGNMDPDSFWGTSFGGSGLQNEEALFQENLKEALIHRAL
jgi:hypothetical protein